MKLRYFSFGRGWGPLLERLEGWFETQSGTWTDGESVLDFTETDPLRPRIGFTGCSVECRTDVVQTPSRLSINLADNPPAIQAGKSRKFNRDYILNHVSIRTTAFEEDHCWFRRLLGETTVLYQRAHWNPLDQMVLAEAHLFHGDDYYVTLRQGSETVLDHIGWMARKHVLVDSAAKILGELNWPIFWGPGELDGSYLVHFRGPDGRIHDFFCPTQNLRAHAS